MNTAVLITLIVSGTLLGITLISSIASTIVTRKERKMHDEIMEKFFKGDK